MTLSELKNEIKNLAFAEDNDMRENAGIVIDAINRAISVIAQTVSPIVGMYQIAQSGSTEGRLKYDLRELTKDSGKVRFGGFIRVDYEHQGREITDIAFRSDFDRYLILDGRQPGLFTVYYRKLPETYTTLSPDEKEIEIDSDLCPLIPLLSSFYVWMDDDERKADKYKNDYEDLKLEFLKGRSFSQVSISPIYNKGC